MQPHFDGRRFFNPDHPQVRGLAEVFRWKLTSRAQPSPHFSDDVQPSIPPRSVDGDELRVTFVNHATVLIQHRGLNILTDPVWSDHASPFTWVGPRRHRAPGVRFEDLPRIDLVLLSHNHYDHLDLATLRRLSAPRFIVPLGVAKLLERERIVPVQELDWGESAKIADASIHCVPAVHFSARGLFDRNRTLWRGFVIEAARVVYFAGDTGFGEHFAQIRERFGSPDLALLPIGGYQPRWFMAAVHMSPEDAVHAHQILGSQKSIAIHHGTFQLTDEAIDTPKRRLIECAPGDSFVVLNHGQSIAL